MLKEKVKLMEWWSQKTYQSKLRIMLAISCLLLIMSMVIAIRSKETDNSALSSNGLDSTTDAVELVNHQQKPKQIYNYSILRGMQREGDSSSRKQSTKVSHIESVQAASYSGPEVSILIEETATIERVPLEQYVLGVALAELPLNFETEAIKAQMLAIRTYIVHRMQNVNNLHTSDDQDEVEQYWVTDSINDQAYRSRLEVEKLRNDARYTREIERFDQALQATEGNILVYKNEPIDAVFFSTSNGYTEAAEDYWGYDIAYLQSVDSKWDKEISPSFEQTITYTYEQLYQYLGLDEDVDENIKITKVKHTESNRVSSLKINGKLFQGREVREKLKLASTHFTWEIARDQKEVKFTTYGYGHGVGMSQWGANGMAQDGYLAEDIVKHYYQGIDIEQASKLVKN